MKRVFATSILSILAIGAALLIAACGGDDEADGASASSDSGVVSVESVDGTDVLVDAEGRTLYSAEQESSDRILCTDGCLSIWEPVEASGDEAAAAGIDADLGSVQRPDGGEQLTLDDRPLYSFTEEGPGELTGDGFVDVFEGTEFEWTAATVGGGEAAPDTSESPAGGFDY